MKLLFLILSLFILKSNGSGQEYNYLRDSNEELTIEDVKESTFLSGTENNLGTKNGTYWFKIDKSLDERSILELKNSHAKDIVLYDATGKLIPSMPDTRFPSFFLINRTLTYPLYLKANFPLEAYFPITISTEQEYAKNDKLSLLSIGLFYGTAIALLIATLIFFVIVKNSQFLFFSLLVFAISLSVTGKDNIFYLLGLSTVDITMLESFGHLIVGFSATGFMLFYLKVRRHQMWVKYGMIALSLVSLTSWITFTITTSIYAFIIVDTTSILTTVLLWVLITQIAKGNIKYFLMALYPINAFILTNAFILHTFGITLIEVTDLHICITAIINFTLIAIQLYLSLRGIQKIGLKSKLEIEKYVEQIKELDSYKNIQDADDSYMESLIYQFKLENIEIKVLSEISKGRRNSYIEEKYNLSDSRLETITNNIYTKLGIESAQELSTIAV